MKHEPKKPEKKGASRKPGARTPANGRGNEPPPASGHLEAGHAARLHRLSQETNIRDTNVAFVAGPRSKDDLTERLGEEAVSSMTSGESQLASDWDRPVEEEDGGPFVETSAGDEFATGTDESNTADATREPFPKTSSAR